MRCHTAKASASEIECSRGSLLFTPPKGALSHIKDLHRTHRTTCIPPEGNSACVHAWPQGPPTRRNPSSYPPIHSSDLCFVVQHMSSHQPIPLIEFSFSDFVTHIFEAAAGPWSATETKMVWSWGLVIVALVASAVWECFGLQIRALLFRGCGPTRSYHTAAIIWMHGIGDRGVGFGFLRNEFQKEMRWLKWVLPDAGFVETTYDGLRKRAWFNVSSMPITTEEPDDAEGIARAVKTVHALIEKEILWGIPPSRIMIGGFSQGAALAAHAAARCPHRLAGCVFWSGHLPQPKWIAAALMPRSMNKGLPFLCCHGEDDDKVLIECGQQAADELRSAGCRVSQHMYKGVGHGCTPEQIQTTKEFIRLQIGDDA